MTFAFKIIAKSIALAFKPGLKKQSNESRILKNFVNYLKNNKIFQNSGVMVINDPRSKGRRY